jgi:hypothetical protein
LADWVLARTTVVTSTSRGTSSSTTWSSLCVADPANPISYFGQEFFEQAEAKTGLTDKAYVATRAKYLQITRDQLLDSYPAGAGVRARTYSLGIQHG